MKDIELYAIVESTIGKEIENMASILPILEDIKKNEQNLYARLRGIIRDYKTALEERICDNRQGNLFEESEEIEEVSDNTIEL